MALAQEHAGEIVSCDSLQVYRGLDIGSAKPTLADRRAVRHHLIDVVDPDEDFSAADYSRLARRALSGVVARGRLPVVVGGTGLYLRALLGGLFEGPSRDLALRRRLEGLAERRGETRLHALLSRVDPETALRIHARDRVRVIRALEVYWTTGKPLSEHHRQQPEPLRGFASVTIGLAPDRGWLRQRVERRTDQMLRLGLIDEVRRLLAHPYSADLRPLRAIGYRQAVSVIRGELSLEEARPAIVTDTMRYAKRQMTWFRRQTRAEWHGDAASALAAAAAWLRASPACSSDPAKSLTNQDESLN